MNIYIKLTIAGTDVGPFSLYSNALHSDFSDAAFETGISRDSLVAGYTTVLAPIGTTKIKVQSNGTCTNSIIIDVATITTSTSTTTLYSSTTTTTTINPSITTTTTTTEAPIYYDLIDCDSETHYCVMSHCTPTPLSTVQYQMGVPGEGTIYCGTLSGTCAGPPVGTIYSCTIRTCGEDPCGIH